MNLRLLLFAAVIVLSVPGWCQVTGTPAGAPSPGQRPTISLQDALVRARLNSPQFRAAVMQAGLAREDQGPGPSGVASQCRLCDGRDIHRAHK